MSDCSDECETFISTRGVLKIFKDGFAYEKRNYVKEVYYWYCELRRNRVNLCTASLTTKLEDGVHKILKRNGNHNHGPDPGRKHTSDFIQSLKNDAKSTMKVCNILQNNKANAPVCVVENLPSTSALKQTIYRQRKQSEVIKEPDDLLFKINHTHTQMDGESFVIKDHIFDDSKRIIILSTLNLMTYLSKSKYWILDGTFKVAPNVFKQLYTIHGNILNENKKTFPLCYCLASNKDKRTYDIIFESIIQYGKEHNIEMNPKVCVLDFEKATILSLRSNFEDIFLHGCLFHVGQIIYRQVQAQGYAKKYAADMTFNKQVKCLLALSYLPEVDIPIYFNKLLEFIQDPDWKELGLWFEENYVSGSWNTQPKYAPSFWSCHKINEMKVPRTSNSAEAWHLKINTIVDKHHPGVYALIKILIKETMSNWGDIENILSGAPPEAKKKRYLCKDSRIERILQNKAEYSEVKLLMCICLRQYDRFRPRTLYIIDFE